MPWKNQDARRAYARNYQKQQRIKRKEKLDAIKTESGCQSCGIYDHPSCLDFHHKNEEDKESLLSGFTMYALTEEKLQKEIDKCMILCKSCHHKYHLGLLSFIE
jgi:5-methylcytosine-specific restriction endonuclease McrA